MVVVVVVVVVVVEVVVLVVVVVVVITLVCFNEDMGRWYGSIKCRNENLANKWWKRNKWLSRINRAAEAKIEPPDVDRNR